MDSSNSKDSVDNKPLQLICPSCNENNELEYGHHIKCNSCDNAFAGFIYKKFKKPILGVKLALCVGLYGGYKIDQQVFEPSRYSTAAIYEIVNSCSNPPRTMSSYEKRELAQNCICALDKTMLSIAEPELSKNKNKFIMLFKQNLKSCN